ncbi:flagellar hook-associated protein FlgL [Pontibacillus litoralis]|uniref:Flagellar hook-associated protein FlgL n=1 Tax=Pontibacillus litoralis JSM 072002 TaxID=1385512 RepID=A0A0A5G583_9BACI|nr:flagellar hook-associated protein FlgL [Pontibacillus litoralis]KGX86313.1 flagellar hook-associated protein FlgL [Pontibacillus litoralis JSM 072002]
MRVTQNMLSNNMLRNMNNSYAKMNQYQMQLATGKKINKPSDDPVSAMQAMNYRSNLSGVEQYERNIGEVHKWMDSTDAALDEATQTIQRLNELAVQASNGTYEQDQLDNIAEEVRQLKDHLKDIGNTQINGKYIFNGNDTMNKPITENPDLQVSDNSEAVTIEVSDGIEMQVNTDPTIVFGEDLFKDIDTFIGRLEGTGEGNIDESIADLQEHKDNFVNARADLGARMNRVELMEKRVSLNEVTATKNLSGAEDADITKVIMNLKIQESVHRATLSAGSRIIQPTLVDFLR